MKRLVLAAAFATLGITAVAAKSDPIAARKAVMKENGAQSRIAREMIDGKQAFDLAKAHKVLTTFAGVDEKAKGLFPDNSKTGGETEALPVIWENKPDFEAKLAKLSADAKDAMPRSKIWTASRRRWARSARTAAAATTPTARSPDPFPVRPGDRNKLARRRVLHSPPSSFRHGVPCIEWPAKEFLMLRKLIVLAVVAAVVGLGVFWVLTMPASVPASALPQRTANVDNGKTMFLIGGCASCHATPGQDDKTKLGGGLGIKSPFGTFYAPNISSDPNDGIGKWTEANFVTAMTKGTSPEGEHLYPAFPYTSYQRMRLDDVRDLYAYLRTLPAVQTPSQPHDLAFPFTVRRGLGLWQLLYVDGKALAPDSSKDAVWNRGAYLVEGPGHCAECHSPRNLIGGIDADRRFAGGPDPTGKGWIPNITPSPDGIPNYAVKDIAYLLESRFTPDFDSVGSSMADVVKNTSKLSAEDRLAIATYIKSLPPRAGKAPPKGNKGD